MNRESHHELDCKGLSCPLPILETRKAMDALSSGDILKILCTDPGSINGMSSWSNSMGHIILSSDEEDGIYIYLIQKKIDMSNKKNRQMAIIASKGTLDWAYPPFILATSCGYGHGSGSIFHLSRVNTVKGKN